MGFFNRLFINLFKSKIVISDGNVISFVDESEFNSIPYIEMNLVINCDGISDGLFSNCSFAFRF